MHSFYTSQFAIVLMSSCFIATSASMHSQTHICMQSDQSFGASRRAFVLLGRVPRKNTRSNRVRVL
ncbi:hypothetical protein P389DRAFT_175084 [Cystobasidium minutum MCA 4210]|uniref:uncharacterized protein n=1 Tax=Cystobasidium minutum MCA 4210 TaxID=1397322 RepID=UPI0034CDE50C|eukprot:jgi/Rhomi1/175084/fgenesh1_kg.9_\